MPKSRDMDNSSVGPAFCCLRFPLSLAPIMTFPDISGQILPFSPGATDRSRKADGSLRKATEGSFSVRHPSVSPWEPFQRRLRSEEHTSELQSRPHLVCRLLLE